MVREISGPSGNQFNLQIKRVSVRSNGAGVNTGVVMAPTAASKVRLVVKDMVSIKHPPATAEKPQR
jgi:hypothetical protein